MNQIPFDISVPSILDVLSISTSFMLGLLFITSKSNNKKANVFLGLFLWSLSIEVLGSFLYSTFYIDFVFINTSLFTIPFLFLYVYQTLNIKLRWFHFLLFLPGIFIDFFKLESLLDDLFNLSILLYMLKTLKFHRIRLGDFYSDIENKTLAWIKTIIYIYLFFHSIWIIEEFLDEDLQFYFALASNFLTFFMIYWIGYNGFSQSEIFSSLQFQKKTENPLILQTENSEKTKQQFHKISTVILEEKLYTDPNLTLRTLSNQLQKKEKEVSKLINLHTHSNFYDFINQFRIEEFKKLLLSSKAKHLSILGLAEEAGFSSKSTFYTFFKKTQGITPKQYQDLSKSSE